MVFTFVRAADNPDSGMSRFGGGSGFRGQERGDRSVGAQPGGISVGVVGVGYWGSKHMRALRTTAGVAAVVGIDQRFSLTNDARDRIDCDYVGCADVAEALPGVDAVVIATPPTSHAPLAMQAIRAGKHVLVEKPLATTVRDAQLLIDAAEAAGVVLMCGHTFEHNAAVQKLRDLIQGQELGRLYYLDCARLNLGLYQSDVNVISDLAPHDISIANFVLGSQPSTVTAWGSRHVHPDFEDVSYLRLDYTDIDVRVNIHVSWLHPVKIRQITAVGSAKMTVYDDLAGDERLRIYDRAAVPPEQPEGPLSQVAYRIGAVVSPFIAFPEPLAVQDQHFIDCVMRGTRPSSDGYSGLRVVHALECAQLSLTEQRPVALKEIPSGTPHRPQMTFHG